MTKFTDTVRKCLGWCPHECPVLANAVMTPERYMDAVPPGRGELRRTDLNWWNRYRNQVMVMAVNLTVVTIALTLLLDDSSGNIWKGFVLGGIIGISAALVTLWHSWTRYDRIDAGEFIEVDETKKQRMIRYFGIFVLSVAFIAWMALWALNAAIHLILAMEVGLCIVGSCTSPYVPGRGGVTRWSLRRSDRCTQLIWNEGAVCAFNP